MVWQSTDCKDGWCDQNSYTDYFQGVGKGENLSVCLLYNRWCQSFLYHDGSPDQDHCSLQRCALAEQNLLPIPEDPWAPGDGQGTINAGRRGECVSDSDESISSVVKKNKIINLSNPSNSSNSDSNDSNSVDSYNSNESDKSTGMDYNQTYWTQLDTYQQDPLEQEHEILFQLDSEESDSGPGTTRSEQQYALAGIKISALSLEDSYTEGTCKLGADEAERQSCNSVINQWSKRNLSCSVWPKQRRP